MHGRCEGGGEGCGKRRRLVRHMWPATRVEAAPPPAQGPATLPSSSSVPPPSTTSYPPSPTTPPASAQKQERLDSPRPVSPDSFVKDGREIRVGDCALFQANHAPPFVGLIRWIEKKEEGYPKLRVSWLYRPADVKLNKGIQLNAAPNEIFYSFHQDETSSVSLLHPCKVAFLRKGVELPTGISSFVCRRVYDIDNKCLWWLTDKDYINERQEEVNRLLYRTRLEMHAAVQSGGRSPKRLNGASAAQQKSGPDGTQNCASSRGKKRDRGEQGNDPAKRDRDRSLKVDESEPGNSKVENMKSEIAKITEKGGLPHAEAVEKLVHLMQLDRTERKIDFSGRVMLADIIAATESPDCLGRFVQLRGLPVLDDWLQEAHKGKSGEGSSPKETDKPIEEFLFALLRALAKLPINLTALQSCSIGKSVNHLRSHKNLEIQKKAKCLVDNWKKRVDAEMKSNDVKAAASGQAVPWPGKAGFAEISNAGNRRSGSSEPNMKNPVSQVSSSKPLTAKSGGAEAVVKLTPAVSGSSKSPHLQPANVGTNSKDQPCKSTGGTGGSELPTVKEDRSSSSSQSLNNSQSCSSDHAKTIGSCKEDARSSTAASGNASKIFGGSSRGRRRANNGHLGSGIQKEVAAGRFVSFDRSSLPEKSSQSGMACEKGGDTPSDHANSHRLIVRFPNPGRSPARSVSGGSFEDPSVTGSGASSPVHAYKHEHDDRRVKMKTEHSRPHLALDANAESWHSNDIKGTAGSEEGDKSPCATMEDDHSMIAEEAGKDASRVASSSYVNEKGACSSETRAKNPFNPMSALIEIKYSEAGPSLQAGDDTAMNLLASVAGEMSKSELVSPSDSPRNSSANEEGCEGDNIGKLKEESDVDPSQYPGTSGEVGKVTAEKQEKNDAFLVAKEERDQMATGTYPISGTDSKAFESSAKTVNHEEERTSRCSSLPASVDSQGEHTAREKVEDGCSSSPDVVDATLGGQCSLVLSNKKPELLPAEESSLSAGKQHQGLKSNHQNQLVGVPDHTEAIDRCGESTAGSLDLKSAVPFESTEVKKGDGLGVANIALKEEEKKEQCSSTSVDVTKPVVSAAPALGVANGINKTKESKDSSSESSSHVNPCGMASQEAAHSTRHSSEKSSDDEVGKEDLVSSDEGSSFAAKGKSSTAAKLDFDLNEGIPGDEGHQFEPASSPMICSSVRLPCFSPFVSPISSGLPAPITVAAPAKGPFVPPENLLRVKSETGWKGSAATSAFRPAEPRKILEMPLATPDIPVSGGSRKQSRPAFDIDLNVADDQALEEDVPQSSAQTTGSESGNTISRDGPLRSAGIEFDLNRADEVAENGQVLSMFPARPLPELFSNTDRNSLRNFDLNNGPSLDEAGTEPAPRSLASKNSSSIPFLPQVAGIRMNNAETSSISPWFASGTHGAPVAIQSFLPARGEQPYPIEAAPGTQRIIASAADSGQFGNDSSRTPVISTSPTMVFHPPAYQYAGFPFTPNVHLQAPGFSIGSTSFVNSAPAGVSYFPTITPSLVGPTGVLPGQHVRPYAINLPEGSSGGGHDINRKWGRQGLDLNSGPGIIEVEGKDERMPLPVRQTLITPPHALVEDQARIYQMPGVGIKRKEPEGSWAAERSQHKQLSWQ
ncbi:uncharacterized protein LOC133921265 isoform X2 [Phragmites australis]|uniref:uncharacterized protein LOC133921265 isoform X2 n=1 Tax=Phragmites australis TaxID=29695 RepID=UPI002D79BC1D|nr:uncharacterized protein LOC133921265 isoform X2 [Phragmites australis]